MPGQPIVIVGTGGSGRETLMLMQDIERSRPGSWDFKGFVGIDAPKRDVLDRLSAPFLGDPGTLVERIPEARAWAYSVGIGVPGPRRRMDNELMRQGLRPATLIHPSALIGPDVNVGPGAVICAHSVITTNVRIGVGAQINFSCVIAHDARLGDFVTLAQSVNIAGNVTVSDDAIVYTNASILPGVALGEGAVVGAGAVVTKDVSRGSTVAGVPARPLA